ncbi:MAG: AMP-binding protein, partial [Angustibacter sp.]
MSDDTQLPDPPHLAAVLYSAAQRRPDQILFGRRVANGWVDVTAEDFAAQVTALAKGFIAAGVMAGDRVGLMAKTRYEWTLCDFALWAAAAVPVPIYETSAPEQVRWILADSGAVGCVVESAAQSRCLAELAPQLPTIREVWELDHAENPIDRLIGLGLEVPDDEVFARQEDLRPSSLATLI